MLLLGSAEVERPRRAAAAGRMDEMHFETNSSMSIPVVESPSEISAVFL